MKIGGVHSVFPVFAASLLAGGAGIEVSLADAAPSSFACAGKLKALARRFFGLLFSHSLGIMTGRF